MTTDLYSVHLPPPMPNEPPPATLSSRLSRLAVEPKRSGGTCGFLNRQPMPTDAPTLPLSSRPERCAVEGPAVSLPVLTQTLKVQKSLGFLIRRRGGLRSRDWRRLSRRNLRRSLWLGLMRRSRGNRQRCHRSRL